MKSHRLKIAGFLLITAFIFLGPFYGQVLGGEKRIFRRWVMWSAKGMGILDLRLYGINEKNEKEFINFKSVLLKTNISESEYKRLRKLKSRAELSRVIDIVCSKSQYSIIQMKLRRATKEGWKTVYDRETNICRR